MGAKALLPVALEIRQGRARRLLWVSFGVSLADLPIERGSLAGVFVRPKEQVLFSMVSHYYLVNVLGDPALASL